MTKIEIKGVIVMNDYKEIYDWFGMENTSPSDVISQLPTDNSPIEIIINSPGGHVDAGTEIYSRLKEYEGEVTTKVFSMAASSASIIAMAGDKVLIAPPAQLMIHNVTGLSDGDYREHQHNAKIFENYNKAIANAYVLKTGKSEEEILHMMNEETFLNAQQAVEHGFADGIMFESKMQIVASANITMLPQNVVEKARQMMKLNNANNIISNEQLNYIVERVTDILKQNQKEPSPKNNDGKGSFNLLKKWR